MEKGEMEGKAGYAKFILGFNRMVGTSIHVEQFFGIVWDRENSNSFISSKGRIRSLTTGRNSFSKS